MFWVKKYNTHAEQEIDEFAQSRKKYSSTKDHVKSLNDFVKILGVISFDDVTPGDIQSYISMIEKSITSFYERSMKIQAINLFMIYKKTKIKDGIIKRYPGRPEKSQRNIHMFELRRMSDEWGRPLYSYADIAKRYRLNKKTVYDIIKRLENKG